MIWPFNKSTPVVEETTTTIPYVPEVNLRLREGMWVNASGHIGILTRYVDSDSVEVTHTKADGTTVMILNPEDIAVPSTEVYPIAQVNQARISEVPRPRYESETQLRSMGYGD